MTTKTEIQNLSKYKPKRVFLEQPNSVEIGDVRTIAFEVTTSRDHRKGPYPGNILFFTPGDNKASYDNLIGIDVPKGGKTSFYDVLDRCSIPTDSPIARGLLAQPRGVVSSDAVARCAADAISKDLARQEALALPGGSTKNTYTLTTEASIRRDAHRKYMEETQERFCVGLEEGYTGNKVCQWFKIEKKSYPHEHIFAYLNAKNLVGATVYGYLFNVHGDPAKSSLFEIHSVLEKSTSKKFSDVKDAKFKGHKLISNLPHLFKQLYVLWQAENTKACGIIEESYIHMNVKKDGTPGLQALPIPFDKMMAKEQESHVVNAWPTHILHTVVILEKILTNLTAICLLNADTTRLYENLLRVVQEIPKMWHECVKKSSSDAQYINSTFKETIEFIDGEEMKFLISEFAKNGPRRPRTARPRTTLPTQIRRSQVARPLQTTGFGNKKTSKQNTKAYTTPGTTVTTKEKTITYTTPVPNQNQKHSKPRRPRNPSIQPVYNNPNPPIQPVYNNPNPPIQPFNLPIPKTRPIRSWPISSPRGKGG